MLLLCALIVGSGSAWATNPVTKSMTSFSAISGNVDGDENISYEAAQGTASTAPAVNSNEIRVYQNGGTFTVTANNGVKINSVTLGSSMGTTVTYSIDDGTASSNQSISANSTITVNNLDCSSVLFTCTGTTKNTRLYVNSLSVTYTPSGTAKTNIATIDNDFAPATVSVGDLDDFSLTITPAVNTMAEGTDYTISWESDDEDILEVADGTYEAKATGKANVTVTVTPLTNTDTYKEVSRTFEVTVNKAPHVAAYNEVFYESFDGCNGTGGNDGSWSGSIASTTLNKENMLDNATAWTFSNEKAASECAKFGTGGAGGSAKATLNLAAGIYILSFKAGAWNGNSEGTTLNLSATGASLNKGSVTTTKGKFSDFTATLTVTEAGEVSFTFSTDGGNKRFFLDEVQLIVNNLTAEVQSYGWASYIPEYDVQFVSGDAYVVTAASVSAGLTMTAVTSVPAGTPVLLKGAGDKTITLLADAPSAPATNLLSVATATTPDGKFPYVLAKNGDGACFKQWTGDAATLKDRVVLYLDEAVATARSIFMLDSEPTGIEAIEHSSLTIGQTVYNLNGQRVSSPQKGLYIVNGKKVMMK